MNSYGKKLMGIALIAALSSGITIGAFSILNKSADSKIQDQSLDSGYAQPTRFTRVINRPAVETDFTTAAENTDNAANKHKIFVFIFVPVIFTTIYLTTYISINKELLTRKC